jgi:hypothetical protein
MKIYEINDNSNTKVIEILKQGITKDMFKNKKLFENYLYEYKENATNLFSLLATGRYKLGNYFVITDDKDNYIASSGWYHYNEDTALVLTRMLVTPKYRTSYIVGHELLPLMIERTSTYSNVWITCNEYNKPIYDWFSRSSEGKSPSLYRNWPEVYKKFKPIGQHTVNGLPQYVAALEK